MAEKKLKLYDTGGLFVLYSNGMVKFVSAREDDNEPCKIAESIEEFQRGVATLRQKIGEHPIYSGLFVCAHSNDYCDGAFKLIKRIELQHVTMKFMPEKLEHPELMFAKCKLRVIGYGNDGLNEAYRVEWIDGPEAIREDFEKLEAPHITLSVAEGAKPVDSRFLKFKAIKEIEVIARYGYYNNFDQLMCMKATEALKHKIADVIQNFERQYEDIANKSEYDEGRRVLDLDHVLINRDSEIAYIVEQCLKYGSTDVDDAKSIFDELHLDWDDIMMFSEFAE